MRFYSSQRVMRGHGLGRIFASLLRRALPFLKQGGKYLAKKAAHTGVLLTSDIASGENPRQAVKKRLREVKSQVKGDARKRIIKFVQTGKGVKRSTRNKKRKRGKKTTAARKKKSVNKKKKKAVNRKKTQQKKKKKRVLSRRRKKPASKRTIHDDFLF